MDHVMHIWKQVKGSIVLSRQFPCDALITLHERSNVMRAAYVKVFESIVREKRKASEFAISTHLHFDDNEEVKL